MTKENTSLKNIYKLLEEVLIKKRVDYKDNDNEFSIKTEKVGELIVKDGNLIVSDPLNGVNKLNIITNYKVDKGVYPIHIIQVKITDKQEGKSQNRNGLVYIQFNQNEISNFNEAAQKSFLSGPEGKDYPVIMSIDTGCGSVYDNSFATSTDILYEWDDTEYLEKLESVRNKPSYVESSSANLSFDNGETNIFIFDSGYGDGAYGAYWALDKEGKPVGFVIDLEVLPLE